MLLATVTVAALPWLQGFFVPAAASDARSYDCGNDDPQLVEIRADVAAAAAGVETISASYSAGVVVRDRAGKALAQRPGFDCAGSADELVGLAAGDGFIGVPLIALAATTGGKQESATQLMLFRVGAGGALELVFSGEVERHQRGDERSTRTGTVTLVPGGLVHQEPMGGVSLWSYDASAGRYVEGMTTPPRPAS